MQYYDNLEELPIWNWDKVHETDNTLYLEVRKDYSKLPQDKNGKHYPLWMDLYDQYIDEFGLSDKFKDLLRLRNEMGILRADLIINKDKINLTHIRTIQREIEDIQGDGSGSLMDHIVVLEKHFSFPIDPKQTSVLKYFTYLRDLENHNKEARKWAAK